MKNVLVFSTVIFFITFIRLRAQAPDSCLKLWMGVGEVETQVGEYSWAVNPDSIKIDSCEGSATYLEGFTRREFLIAFNIEAPYFFKQVPIPKDTNVTWDDIDTINYLSSRNEFQQLEKRFGNFVFSRKSVDTTHATASDIENLYHQAYYITFNNYSCIDSVIYYLNQIDSISIVKCKARGGILVSVYNQKNKNNNSKINILPNPARDYISIQLLDIDKPEYQITIINILGKVFFTRRIIGENKFKLELTKFPPGVYFLKIDKNIQPFLIIK